MANNATTQELWDALNQMSIAARDQLLNILVGRGCTRTGADAHTEGNDNTASGAQAHAEGRYNTASGAQAHAEGRYNTASGQCSHVEGNGTLAEGFGSHAEGDGTSAMGLGSHAEGNGTAATGPSAHSEGDNTYASGVSSHAEGRNTWAIGDGSHASGNYAVALVDAEYSHSASRFADSGMPGDAQYCRRIATTKTIDATPKALDGGSSLVIPANTTWTFDIYVTARRVDGSTRQSAGYNIKGVIVHDGASTALVGSVVGGGASESVALAETASGWDVAVTADDTHDALLITVTGATGATIYWCAVVNIVQVSGLITG